MSTDTPGTRRVRASDAEREELATILRAAMSEGAADPGGRRGTAGQGVRGDLPRRVAAAHRRPARGRAPGGVRHAGGARVAAAPPAPAHRPRGRRRGRTRRPLGLVRGAFLLAADPAGVPVLRRTASPALPALAAALGARGSALGRRLGRRLGWPARGRPGRMGSTAGWRLGTALGLDTAVGWAKA